MKLSQIPCIPSQLFTASMLKNYLHNSTLGPEGREWILKNMTEPVIQKVMLEKLDMKLTITGLIKSKVLL